MFVANELKKKKEMIFFGRLNGKTVTTSLFCWVDIHFTRYQDFECSLTEKEDKVLHVYDKGKY